VVNRGNVESQPIARNTVISYVRGPHDDEVVGFARRLISEGVPCDLDLFESSPAGGWSRWMAAKMTTSDVVLVVCSRAYDERFLLLERRGVGKGVTFESGMLSRRVLEAPGLRARRYPNRFRPSGPRMDSRVPQGRYVFRPADRLR